MRPTHPYETHRRIGAEFAVDAYDALAQLVKDKRTSFTAVLRRGAALALREHGDAVPPSLRSHAQDEGARQLDPIDGMLALAPCALSAADLTRLVGVLAAQTKLTLADVRRLAAILGHGATDFDYHRLIGHQLFPQRPDHVAVAATPSATAQPQSPEDRRPALRVVESVRPVGSPPWGEP